MNDPQHPETDREYALCWNIFTAAPDQTTTGELRTQMTHALVEHRQARDRRMMKKEHVHESYSEPTTKS